MVLRPRAHAQHRLGTEWEFPLQGPVWPLLRGEGEQARPPPRALVTWRLEVAAPHQESLAHQAEGVWPVL